MKDPQTSTAIECCLLEKSSGIQTGKYNLLVHFKYSISLMLFRRQIITGKHIIKYLILHRLRNFKSVEIESAFLPTLIYSSNTVASIL